MKIKVLNQKVELIENSLQLKKIQDYEIFFIEGRAIESIFLKDQVDNERDVKHSEYIIRILSQRGDQTGIGIIKEIL